MVTSLSPLGERTRGGRWQTTFALYVFGGVAGGVSLASVMWALGFLLRGVIPFQPGTGLLILGPALAVAGLAELVQPSYIGGLRRQVNEEWLYAYRRWVYAVSFGWQLGAGILTHVSTAAIYAVALACFLSHNILTALLIGTVFGLTRSGALIVVREAHTVSELLAVDDSLERASRWASVSTALALFSVSVVAALGAVSLT